METKMSDIKQEDTTNDPFYSMSNIEHLRRGVKELNEGKGKIHEIVEDYE